MEKARLLSEMK